MIRAVYLGEPPAFPPVDQHPDARRFGPIALTDGRSVYVDAIGERPSDEAIEALFENGAGVPGERQDARPLAASQVLDAHLTAAIDEFSEPKPEPPAPPPAPPAPAPSQGKPAMSSPGSHALNIKQLLEEHGQKLDQILQAQFAALKTELDGQVVTVVDGTEAVIRQVRGNTADFKAILGQFTNEL